MSQIKVDSIIPTGGVPSGGGGGIIQIVKAVKNNTASLTMDGSTNNVVAIPGLSCQLTMLGSSNMVRIQFEIDYAINRHDGRGGFQIFRGSSAISGALGTASGNRYTATSGYSSNATDARDQTMLHASGVYYDTPGAGTHTYTMRCKSSTSSPYPTVYINRGRNDRDQADDPRTISHLEVQEVSV